MIGMGHGLIQVGRRSAGLIIRFASIIPTTADAVKNTIHTTILIVGLFLNAIQQGVSSTGSTPMIKIAACGIVAFYSRNTTQNTVLIKAAGSVTVDAAKVLLLLLLLLWRAGTSRECSSIGSGRFLAHSPGNICQFCDRMLAAPAAAHAAIATGMAVPTDMTVRGIDRRHALVMTRCSNDRGWQETIQRHGTSERGPFSRNTGVPGISSGRLEWRPPLFHGKQETTFSLIVFGQNILQRSTSRSCSGSTKR